MFNQIPYNMQNPIGFTNQNPNLNMGNILEDRINTLEQKVQSLENRINTLEKKNNLPNAKDYEYQSNMYMM